jgi:hypothetical protein
MGIITANGIDVVDAEMSLPLARAWHVDATVNTGDKSKLTGSVSLSISDGKLTLVGTGKVVDSFNDTVRVRIVAGAGGLPKPATAKYYQQVPARIVLLDLLAAAGESLSPKADTSALSTILASWTVKTGPVAEAIALLMDKLGASWRMLADGSFWCGQESWPDAGIEYTIEQHDTAHNQLTLSSEAPLLLPGTTIEGLRASYVEHHVSPEKVETNVLLQASDGGGDRSSEAFVKMVRASVPQIDYHGLYRAQILAQSTDKRTVDVRPDDARFPQMSGVPIRHGLPGVTVQITPGAYVLVGWMGADPLKTYCAVWEDNAQPISITITNIAGDSITLSGGQVTIKAAGVQVVQASPTTLALGLIGSLPVLVQGAFDSMGVPVTQNPVATATIVRAG